MKKLFFLALVLLICITSLGVMNDRLERAFLPKPSDVSIHGLPQGFALTPLLKSYEGQHPRELIRPEETFKFPIKYGRIGPHEPLFAGDNDYPFLCSGERSNLGQPVLDNQDAIGVSVYAEDESGSKQKKVIGYSKDCGLKTRVEYFVKDDALNGFIKVADRSAFEQSDAKFIRVETGTINRFIYVLAIPVSSSDMPDKFNHDKWNNRLIYRFKGGVGVGRQQGTVNIPKLLYEHEPQLMNGYAVAFSTGTQTSNHYDIWLSEDTALRVKRQFTARYGEPLYTVGMGASGGAIQQYLLAQNHHGIIDAAIPLYSYPDMVTQVNYALDCELLEYYFDVISDDDMWQSWPNRTLIEGSNALDDVKNRYGKLQGIAGILTGDITLMPSGASECTNGWRGPSQHINNPKFYSGYHAISKQTYGQVDWSHWGDLTHIYGTDETGLGQRFWNNDGVQYGLKALTSGNLSVRNFIDINKRVGGWKPVAEMENERFWHISGDDSFRDLSVWSHHNMTHEGQEKHASRTKGSQAAVKASYDSGLVFLGVSNIPMIDLRHYLDHKLDMHHSVASFTSRKRIEAAMGSTEHHLIWMSEKDDSLPRRDLIKSLPIADALRVLDQWVINIKKHPEKSLAQNRPKSAGDRCYDRFNNIIDNQPNTWDGAWNSKYSGECQKRFPHYSHSRIIAGGSIYDDTLQCEKISVTEAMKQGVYGGLDMKPYLGQLNRIFPEGVCEISQQPNPYVKKLVSRLNKKQG